ncbi:hypothetical protein KEJ47_06775 [Candidatus Bathyarchaeota archaeon]|nr:hypothetical protein [Candidatus Bathyarchaeota archaeon]
MKQWSCPVEEDEIPVNICHLCIEARKTQNAFVTVNRVETSNLIIEQEVIEDGWTSFLSLDREFENEEIDIEEYLQKRKDVLKKIGKAKNIRYSSFF